MYFNRIEAKMAAKASMRQASPSPLLVSLVYLLLTGALTALIRYLFGNPLGQMTRLLTMGYEPEEVFSYVVMDSLPSIWLFFAVSLLLEVYTSLMGFGFTSYTLRLARNESCGIGNLFDGFHRPLRVLGAVILIALFQTLWGLLGMIPGMAVLIIGISITSPGLAIAGYVLATTGVIVVEVAVSLRYRLSLYFLLDDPECTARQAIARSKSAMTGWKMELFTLDLSFIGWLILSGLTAGILMIWAGPYMSATEANFYDTVTGRGYDRPQIPPARYTYDPKAPGDGPSL